MTISSPTHSHYCYRPSSSSSWSSSKKRTTISSFLLTILIASQQTTTNLAFTHPTSLLLGHRHHHHGIDHHHQHHNRQQQQKNEPTSLKATNNTSQNKRRSFIITSGISGIITFLPSSPAFSLTPTNDDDLKNNEFIQKLKERSDANRDYYKKQSMSSDKLSTKQFADQYKRPRFIPIKTSEGMKMVLEEDFLVLKDSNFIRKDYEKGYDRDGSEFLDKSKMIYVLIEDGGGFSSVEELLKSGGGRNNNDKIAASVIKEGTEIVSEERATTTTTTTTIDSSTIGETQ